jgi:hypothetical protein
MQKKKAPPKPQSRKAVGTATGQRYSDDDVADRERCDALNVFSEAATNAITRLQDENIALKAKLDTVLQLLGESRNFGKKSVEIVKVLCGGQAKEV